MTIYWPPPEVADVIAGLRAALTREKARADAAEARLAAAAKVSPMCAENTDLRARAERAEEALRRLVERLDYVHADPAYQSVWTIAQMHVGPYRGPQYVEALIVARSALAGGKAP